MNLQRSIKPETIQAYPDNPTSAAVGFALMWQLAEGPKQRAMGALGQALRYFDDFDQTSTACGTTDIVIWGRGKLSDCYRHLSDGSLIINIGSPMDTTAWPQLIESLLEDTIPDLAVLDGDARYIHLWISPDGKCWMLRNDWVGSIPVFYTHSSRGGIASTLEPVVVAGGNVSEEDIFSPALVALLIHGNFLGDWTLFKNIRVVPPDCVFKWIDNDFQSKRLFTVQASDSRWETGWDELIDEMYFLSRNAIEKTLRSHPTWILPLSSGLDSRLIASVAAQLGVNCTTYTWGTSDTCDVEYAKKIAGVLGLPWKQVNLGGEYLHDYNQLWADLFGSAMHFHGMYQMPFLESLKSEPDGPIVSGFLGDVLSGDGTKPRIELFSSNDRQYQAIPDGYLHWLVKDIPKLMRIDAYAALDEIADEIDRMISSVNGSYVQKLRFVAFWGRQRHFTYFSSMLSDYWRGVGTPYLDPEYARFCVSLPRCVLDDRRLLREMFKRCYSRVATIPGSFGDEPMYFSVRYILKRRLAQLLYNTPLSGSIQLVNSRRLSSDIDCVNNAGWDAFWPIQDTLGRLNEWINIDILDEVYNQAVGGSTKAVRQLQCVQTIAYRLNEL